MKTTRFLLFLATVVIAVTAFTACSSDDEIVGNDNGTEQYFGEPIKAQFTISIPMESGTTTRMSAATVQNDQDIASFRGIDFINLFPSTATDITGTSSLSGAISLSQILRPTQVAVQNYIPSKQLVSNNNSVLYGDVLIPTGVKSFLFYGKATDNNEAGVAISTAADKFKFGTLKATVTTDASTPAGFTFSPVAIAAATDGDTKRTAIVTYLNLIAQAKYTDTTVPSAPVDRFWYNETNAVLGGLYTNFKSMKAGSSTNLQAAITDLYNSVRDNAHTVATAVKAAIANSTYVTIATDATTNLSSVTFKDNIAGYPADINLPDGSAVLKYDDASHSFSYVGVSESYPGSTPVVSDLNTAQITNFAYPANLYYWVKSPIKVSNSSQAANYIDTKNWTEILDGYDAVTDAGITNTTRSVALVNPVQYGVGRLDIKVVSNKDALEDNGEGKTDGKKTIPYGNIALTGILIGQQKAVDWKFEPETSATATEYTVYDNIVVANGGSIAIARTTTSTTTSTPYQNHTLVLETAGSATECVNVALEFVNNGDDFWGLDGRVLKGTKFYLLGKLDMADSQTSGKTNTGNKVFKQDFKTLATFTISSLKSARNTIPDLRNPLIELGLSVDLQWKEGVTFDHTIQ